MESVLDHWYLPELNSIGSSRENRAPSVLPFHASTVDVPDRREDKNNDECDALDETPSCCCKV